MPNVELENMLSTERKMPKARDPLSDTDLISAAYKIDPAKLQKVLDGVERGHSPYPIRTNLGVQSGQEQGPILTNHFYVQIKANLYKYQIIGIPEGSRLKKRMFVDTIIQKAPVLLNNQDKFATDYLDTIISWTPLHNKGREKDRIPLVRVKEGAYELVSTYLEFKGQVDTKSLEDYVNVRTTGRPGIVDDTTWDKNQVIEALNIVLAKRLGRNVERMGNDKFFVRTSHRDLGQSLMTLRGYSFTVRPGMGEILLQISAGTSAFFRPIALSQLMDDANTFGNDYPSILKGLRVYIDYTRGRSDKAKKSDMNKDKRRIKRIFGLGKAADEQEFVLTKDQDSNTLPQPTTVTVKDYLMSGKCLFEYLWYRYSDELP